MAKPDPVTLGKAAVYAFKFEKGLHETRDALRKAATEMIDQLNAEVPVFIDKILRLAVEEEVPEIMNILQASPEEQRAYLDKARKSAGLTKSTNPKQDLKKMQLPSSEELISKIIHRQSSGPPYYTHQFNPNPKSDPPKLVHGVLGSEDDIRRTLSAQAFESIRKRRQDLMKSVADSPEAEIDPGAAANFMTACIESRMNEGENMEQAKEWCENYLKEKFDLEPEPNASADRRQLVDAADEKMRKTMEECIKRKREADPDLTEEAARALCGDVEKTSKIPGAQKMFNDLTKKQQP